MCHQNSSLGVSEEEDVAAEEFLLIYCKPVELYNIIQRRAHHNPSFLPRCLTYKVKARQKSRLRVTEGNVIFNYRDQNRILRKTEVVREFSCPFCLMLCGSFKGLHDHLNSSHDLFMFEFWVSPEYRTVNVSVKLDALRSEIAGGGFDPRLQSFCYCSKPRKRRRLENLLQNAKHVYPDAMWSCLPERTMRGLLQSTKGEKGVNGAVLQTSRFVGENDCQLETKGPKCNDFAAANGNNGVYVSQAQSLDDVECSQIVHFEKRTASLPAPPSNAKTKKLLSERSDPRSGMLLHKRQFFHSHRAQLMDLQEVLSDRDSEDEADDEIADLEDRRMLDDFVDVTKDEKHLMHLWNSFVRKQRVLADGHIPWACEAFLRLHGQELVQTPALFWCWRLFMIKLWNHSLLDASAMNNCSLILQKYHQPVSGPGMSSNP